MSDFRSNDLMKFSDWITQTQYGAEVLDISRDKNDPSLIIDVYIRVGNDHPEDYSIELINFWNRAKDGMCAVCGEFAYTRITQNLGNYIYSGICTHCQLGD
jgi:hypothetical protein